MAEMDTIDEMPNITGNFSNEVYSHHENFYDRLFLELFTIIGLASIATNSLTIFTIFKYKKLRSDTTNILLVHLNIVQAALLFVAPLTIRVAMAVHIFEPVHACVFCSLYQAEFIFMSTVCLFLFLLVCDGHLKLHHKDSHVKFSRIYKFFIAAIYAASLFSCAFTTTLCFTNWMFFYSTIIVSFVCVALLLLFLIIINIVHTVKKRKLPNPNKINLGLSITNIFFLLWTPCFIFLMLTIFMWINCPLLFIFLTCLGFCSPIVNFVYLFINENDFNVFLRQVLTCQCNVYDNETLVEDPVSYNDVNGVRISVK